MDRRYLIHSIESIKTVIRYERASSTNSPAYLKLKRSIKNINKTFQENWLTDKYPMIKSCAETLAGDFPIPVLSICGSGTREIRFTQYLAYLLNPQNPHGIGAEFLIAMFRDLIEKEDIRQEDLICATATAEVGLDAETIDLQRRRSTCDVVLEFKDYVIFIEQKIHAAENYDAASKLPQLKRYSKAIALNPKYNNKKIHKYYLTPFGKASTDTDWIPITHQQIITAGLQVVGNIALSATARQNMSRFLMDISVGPYIGTEDNLKKLGVIADVIVQSVEAHSNKFPKKEYIRFIDLFNQNESILKVMKEEKQI